MVTFTKAQYERLLGEILIVQDVRRTGQHLPGLSQMNRLARDKTKELMEICRKTGDWDWFWKQHTIQVMPIRNQIREIEHRFSDKNINGLYTLLAHLRGKLHVTRKLVPRSDGSGKLTAVYVTMEEQEQLAAKVAEQFLS